MKIVDEVKIGFWAKNLFFIAVLLLSGCGSIRSTHTLDRINVISATPTKKTAPLIVEPTRIYLTASPTLTIQPTATNTLVPTHTVTLTPYPTLKPEEAQEIIRAYLKDGSDCENPCFLGIIPGKTTLQEAVDIFTHLGLFIKSITYKGLDIYGAQYELNTGLSIIGNLTIQDDIVKNIRVDITPETQNTGVSREWSAYSPETLISSYGRPSGVHFFMDWGPRSFFEMVMVFDAVDLIVEYTGYDLIPRMKGSPKICPLSAHFDGVRLWMGEEPIHPPGEGALLEEATSMTKEEFSELMTGDPDLACFIVNGDVFP